MTRFVRSAAFATAALLVATSSCNDQPTALKALRVAGLEANDQPSKPALVISQVYGGGGNSGGVFRNDFIEIFNPGASAVNVAGWSVQYIGANTATSWAVTPITGTIPAGGYYLVQEAIGANNPAQPFLPTPDAIGTIAMGATDGKVALVASSTALTGGCPTANAVDLTSYGSTSCNPNSAQALTNATASIRNTAGCFYTGNPATDFTRGTPTPRNSATALHLCGTPGVITSVTVTSPLTTMYVGNGVQLTATARDFGGTIVPTTFTWEGDGVSATGFLQPLTQGSKSISATAPNGVLGSVTVTAITAPDVHIVELHYDNDGNDVGEAFEVDAAAGTSLAGWSVVLYNGNGGVPYSTINLGGTMADQCAGRGVLSFLAPGLQNGAPDGLALVAPGGVVEFLSYEGTFAATGGPAIGMTSLNIGKDEDGDEAPGNSLQKDAIGWFGPNPASFGACNAALPPFVSIGGRGTLPVGFEDQFFATLNDGRGATSPSTFTWTSANSDIATADSHGIIHAVSAGAVDITVTAATGAVGTRTFTMFEATPGAASYANHLEFGKPVDADSTDEVIISRTEYTSSFSKTRGIPNWVSFNLEASHFGTEDRCDCFTFDPLVAATGLPVYTTADYTGAGAAAGYGIDRGHLARSFDRTSGSLDNARTFYFSNIVPQASDNNQGPWAAMEIAVGDMARFQNKELFVISGASGSKGTVKGEGKITIPSHMWKVVVVLPRDQGLADVHSKADLEVIAVIIPNDPGIRNVDWNTYRTTVDAIEALSGYDVLSLLPDQVEIAVESNTSAPAAVLNGPYAALRNESVSMSGAGTDPDAGDVLSYSWNFGDGQTGVGANVTHTYSTTGSFTVTLTVTDQRGLYATATSTATIQSPMAALQDIVTTIDGLVADGAINNGNGNSLKAKLDAAIGQLASGNATPARNQLEAFLNELSALQRSRISAADAAALRAAVMRVLATI